MMPCLKLAAGFRRHDMAFLAAEQLAKQFEGLSNDLTPGRVLAAFKRAGQSMGTPRSIIHMIDQLFARTKAGDWAPGCEPIVWPRNETLAEELGVSVRQLQNMLKQAVTLGLLAMKDSPNGHRGGRRGPNGAIMWAYGIDLRPLGTRYAEFLQIAAVAETERRHRDDLRRRLTIARKSVAQIAQAGLDARIHDIDWSGEVELARMAASHARELRSIESLTAVVEQLEQRRERLLTAYNQRMAPMSQEAKPVDNANFSVDISPTDEADCTDSTTTKKLLSPKGQQYSAGREDCSDGSTDPYETKETSVSRDLERHEIGPAFIARVCVETCGELPLGVPRWADISAIARREAEGLAIPRQAWHEAQRVMGPNGAAAAMIAIAHKADSGLIEKPGAYLRGMTARAARGELLLGKTFHGIRDEQAKRHSAPEAVRTALAARPSPRAFRNAQELIRQTASRWNTKGREG